MTNTPEMREQVEKALERYNNDYPTDDTANSNAIESIIHLITSAKAEGYQEGKDSLVDEADVRKIISETIREQAKTIFDKGHQAGVKAMGEAVKKHAWKNTWSDEQCYKINATVDQCADQLLNPQGEEK
jgi:Glu-tRNA(Gln) amidotransferase subunit E-like FAD-binding protein